ncbi:nitrogen-specific signal transduction histidine kinase NtrB [Moraxella macacae 0408225]|uniref:histidine kinase n=1 Tax=Moraxella macacae 0408225 TaxID=1230338 RepID=L2F6I3_9GAMM|nr:ATP-binding protein [Moraxella macacae]ELA08406.1 nitrogen-specific signal transduction histidine kinase NtrB [Moraxella macacae 0408225]
MLHPNSFVATASLNTEHLSVNLLQNLLTGVLVLNENYQIILVNNAAEQILAASFSQISTLSIFRILQPVDTLAIDKLATVDDFEHYFTKQLNNARQVYQAFIQHDVKIHGVSKPILVDYGVASIALKSGIGFVIELWEKDRQTLIQQEQQQQAQHHITRQLICSMAHEIKNPLAGILGATQLLQRALPKLIDKKNLTNLANDDQNPLAKIENYLNIISSETKRLNNLVEQLLGKPTLPNWQAINIHEPIQQVLALLENQHQTIDFVKDYDLSLPEIVADKDQLIQVFLNLLNNAIYALANESKPVITVQTRIAYQYTINDIRHKSVLQVNVMDNGIGIDKTLLPRIFYPLVTGRVDGTGLGLSVVQDIVHRHQGLIKVQSEPRKTVFGLFLPFKQNH